MGELFKKIVLKQKEIVLLPYPYTNQQDAKIRPAVVISNDVFNQKSNDFIMLPLTSVIKDEPYSILITENDLSSGKLIKLSRIRADKIFTVEKKLIITKIGMLSEQKFQEIKSKMISIF